MQGQPGLRIKADILAEIAKNHRMMKSHKAFNVADCFAQSFRRTLESSHIKVLLDAGVPRHDGKQPFTTFCDAIILDGVAESRRQRSYRAFPGA